MHIKKRKPENIQITIISMRLRGNLTWMHFTMNQIYYLDTSQPSLMSCLLLVILQLKHHVSQRSLIFGKLLSPTHKDTRCQLAASPPPLFTGMFMDGFECAHISPATDASVPLLHKSHAKTHKSDYNRGQWSSVESQIRGNAGTVSCLGPLTCYSMHICPAGVRLSDLSKRM